MKFVRVFVYLFQFRFNIRYKLKKIHIIFDIFNRLFISNCISNNKNDVFDIENFHIDMINSKNDVIYVYNETLIIFFDEFKKNCKKNIKMTKFESKF